MTPSEQTRDAARAIMTAGKIAKYHPVDWRSHTRRARASYDAIISLPHGDVK